MTQSESQKPVWRVAVEPKQAAYDVRGQSLSQDIHEIGLAEVSQVASTRLFFLRGDLDAKDVERIARELLADPVTETFAYAAGTEAAAEAGAAVEVHLKPGVMDPVAASTVAAIRDMGADIDAARTGRRYVITGARGIEVLELIAHRVLANDCIEEVYLTGFGRRDETADVFRSAPVRPFALRHIPLRDLDDKALRALSREAHLFLSLDEMRAVQSHFREAGREPTDLELETLAQTWSEHCVHKTLKSDVVYRGAPMPGTTATGEVEIRYENLLRDTIARATHELIADGTTPWCLSVFEDNAGVIAFDADYAVAFKVETHNHPSAIEPYGGAATGSGGVIRDVMGCGLGAKPIANTDVFCVGLPDFPLDLLPTGVLHPRRILKGIVAGVRDYGNRMGIPTLNGTVIFDPRYMGNPLVFCGCVGLMPRNCIAKRANPGDLVVVAGGRTGRDGIHGATFSSAELTDSHADEFSHAVQIGNAITEKKVLDVQLQARDHASGCLYTAVTDCGAGGLSSAVGEMGAEIGATVDLEKVPLKYAGLRYDEIWISEAQERMTFSVPPANWPTLKALCEAEDVEATVIGTFTDTGRLVLRYEGTLVGDISMDFLHNGVPRTRKTAVWNAPAKVAAKPKTDGDCVARLKARLADLNTASKEWIIRQYDHEVQGGSVVKPLVGPHHGPSDAAVIRPRLDSTRGIAIGCGLAPHLADVDPYWMAATGIDEAIRNVVCVGGDPAQTAILDNFCWGNCEDAAVFGALVRACQGCYDAAKAYRAPFISGKDSLNNEFALDPRDAERLRPYLEARSVRLVNNRLRIPETLLISAISIIDDTDQCVTSDAKAGETRFWLLGVETRDGVAYSLADAAELHRDVHKLIRSGDVLAAHDVGEEGVAIALAEMAIGGACNVQLQTGAKPLLTDPFAPWASGYVLQTAAGVTPPSRFVVGEIGRGSGSSPETFSFAGACNGSIAIKELREAWRKPLRW